MLKLARNVCCGEHIRFQTQKRQQEPDTPLDGQMAKMASELFTVAVVYVPRSVAMLCAKARSLMQARDNKQISSAKQTLRLFCLPMWMAFDLNALGLWI